MDKKVILDKLIDAKHAHTKWRIHAQCIVNGMNVEDKVPVLHTTCAFGQWYQNEGQNLLGHLDEFKAIDGPHEKLHQAYTKIHNELIENGYKVNGNQRLYDEDKVANARVFLKELVEISDGLLKKLTLLEDKVKSS
ncbi:MAG: CZB domain-containing protein [Gammaproteobacteria bacterium]